MKTGHRRCRGNNAAAFLAAKVLEGVLTIIDDSMILTSVRLKKS